MSDARVGLVAWLRQKLQDQRSVRVVPYRGYGTPTHVTMRARVLRDPGLPPPEADDSAWENLVASYERLETDEIAGATVIGELGSQICTAITDQDGYCDLHFVFDQPLAPGWHSVRLTTQDGTVAPVSGSILVPPPGDLGIISDIDDTVLESAVTHPLELARLLFLENARTRAIVAGMDVFCAGLQSGEDGGAQHPIFYVSGSPWNLYDLLSDVFRLHNLPSGPIFLRALERDVVLPAIAGHSTLREHKLASIATILATYPARRFVLLGDSGQQDPEIYYQATLDHPGRIAAVYIRDVSEHQRDTQIDALRPSYAAQGVPLIYAGDIGLFAEDGIARGLLRADARARIQSKSR